MHGFVEALFFLLVLQTVTALGRFYVRAAVVKKFGSDDVAVIITLVCFSSPCHVESMLTAPATLDRIHLLPVCNKLHNRQ